MADLDMNSPNRRDDRTPGAPYDPAVTREPQRRGGLPRWLIPLALLGVLAFALINLFDRDDDREVAANTGATTTAVAGGEVGTAVPEAMLPVAAILNAPAQYASQTVAGAARVTDVVSDRGFWIEENGQRLFVVLGEKGAGTNAAEHVVDIEAGQTVRMSGHVYTSAEQVPGGRLENDARQAIAGQKAFLHVNPQDVSVVSGDVDD